jgi:pimeloyl-ACP methyl ester carboxylesterase
VFVSQYRVVLSRMKSSSRLRSPIASSAIGAAERLPEFKHPVLVAWASEDRVMPPEHGRRLAGLLPKARLVEVADSYTLIPLDQPARFAQIIREWLGTAR